MKKEHYNVLKPTKQRLFKGKIYGFDIETSGRENKFILASIYLDKDNYWFFKTPQELIDFLKTKRFHNSLIVATNLSFDFFGTFFNKKETKEFNFLFRGSSLIYAKTYIRDREFKKHAFKKDKDGNRFGNCGKRLVFLDTLNYSLVSVEKAGKIIGVPKLKSPEFLGKIPRNKKEWDYLKKYNLRDSEISKKYLEFLYKTFEDVGATAKLTIASTSMSLFKNKYLNDKYLRLDEPDLLEHFSAYYGGRVEAFSRGRHEDYNYYDFNSLYPSVMINSFPNPNTHRVNHKNTIRYIRNYDGIAEVLIECPYMKYPLLPVRHDNKLLFPTGTFRGWYSNIELRKAIELGYKILKVYKNHYYKENCSPFKSFVTDMYNKRKNYKAEGNPMEYVIKILMNSLYGKFGQKFLNKDNWIPFNHTIEELNKLESFEIHGDYLRVKQERVKPASFCIPIWALYVTAYGRLKLHDAIVKTNPAYVDTDSILTKETLPESNELGDLKLERYIKEGVIVKPKMYAVVDYDGNGYIKIKGVPKRFTYEEFKIFLKNPHIDYDKFMKFKESIRRGFIPNELKQMSKDLDLEDTKRLWGSKFKMNEFETSVPKELVYNEKEQENFQKENEYRFSDNEFCSKEISV